MPPFHGLLEEAKASNDDFISSEPFDVADASTDDSISGEPGSASADLSELPAQTEVIRPRPARTKSFSSKKYFAVLALALGLGAGLYFLREHLSLLAQPEKASPEIPFSLRLRSYRHRVDAERVAKVFNQKLRVNNIYLVARQTNTDGIWFDVHLGAFPDERSARDVKDSIEKQGFQYARIADFRLYQDSILPASKWEAIDEYDIQDYQRRDPNYFDVLSRMPNSPRFSLRFLWTVNPSKAFPLPRTLKRVIEDEEREALDFMVAPFAQVLDGDSGMGVLAQYQDQISGQKTDVFFFLSRDTSLSMRLLRQVATGREAPANLHFRGKDYTGGQWVHSSSTTLAAFHNDGGEFWFFRSLPKANDDAVAFLDEQIGINGLFDYAELRRVVDLLPDSFSEKGETLAELTLTQVGSRYIRAKRNAEWAKLMRGHWAASLSFLDSQGNWSLDIFDFGNDQLALKGHKDLYDADIQRFYRSFVNQYSKFLRGDAVYKTKVHETDAWYLDLYQIRRLKELNFVKDGFVYAFDSFVLPGQPVLLMDDLKARASAMPAFGVKRSPVENELGPIFLE